MASVRFDMFDKYGVGAVCGVGKSEADVVAVAGGEVGGGMTSGSVTDGGGSSGGGVASAS